MLSPEMCARVLACMRSRGRLGQEKRHPLGTLIVECLAGADGDAEAENLFALLFDLEHEGEQSAIALVLAGKIDLVRLVDEMEG